MKEENKDTIIEDPVLEPYFIVRYASGGFAINKRREKEGRYMTVCYPTTFEGCLRKIAEEQINNGTVYRTLIEYMEDWRKTTERFINAVKLK